MDWSALFSTLGLVFVAELGDKTQLAVVTQTCKHRQPWAVFLGASLALITVTALSALGGQVLGQFIPDEAINTLAALAFVAMGCLVAWEAVKAWKKKAEEEARGPAAEQATDCAPSSAWNWKAFTSTFGLLFVAELGDKTQLAVLGLASERGSVWPVFIGGALALTLVTALGVVGGQGLCKLIPARLLLWISAAAFVVMGLLMGLGLM